VRIENGFFLKHLDLENKRAYLENTERQVIAHTSFKLHKNEKKTETINRVSFAVVRGVGFEPTNPYRTAASGLRL
jgi:hypothetical protein